MSTFPALNGEVVTERHVRMCREQGHATHTVNDVASGTCPRCGEVTVTAYDAAFERFRALGHDWGTAASLARESVSA